MDMKALLESLGGRVALVEFNAAWCGPCRAMDPVVEQLKHKYRTRVEIIRIDIDEQKNLALELMVQSIPTFILFQDRVEVKRLVGIQPGDGLQAHLDEAIRDIA